MRCCFCIIDLASGAGTLLSKAETVWQGKALCMVHLEQALADHKKQDHEVKTTDDGKWLVLE